ncbi:MAG: hypothetical protein IJ760_01550 [Bacteroidales bacterium]|nr:hypothetical protein [Bacteroidales bacterium]
MKNFKKVLAFFAAASLLALASCEKVSQSDVLSEGNPTAKSLNTITNK